MILTIARREWRAAFLSPLAWVLLAVHQFVLAWIFLRVLEHHSGLAAAGRGALLTQEISVNLFGFAAVLGLITAPMLAVRTLSGDLRDGTWELLGAAPVRLGEILLGKFLGVAAVTTAAALLPPLTALFLLPAAGLDGGVLLAATAGLVLTGLLFAAVALYGASLSAQPAVGALAGYGVLLGLSVAARAGSGDGPAGLFDWLSWNEHLYWFLLGLVRTGDLAYFVLLTAFFLALTHRRLANRRYA